MKIVKEDLSKYNFKYKVDMDDLVNKKLSYSEIAKKAQIHKNINVEQT